MTNEDKKICVNDNKLAKLYATISDEDLESIEPPYDDTILRKHLVAAYNEIFGVTDDRPHGHKG